MTNQSPTGKRIVESSGPLSASLVFVGESPAAEEVAEGIPFVGRAGKQLNIALRHAGIDRTQVRLMNLVPVRAPGDKFNQHDPSDVVWGRERFRAELAQLTNAKVFVALGANPTEWLLGGKPPTAKRGERKEKEDAFISQWRGSVLPAASFKLGFVADVPAACRPEDYLNRLNLNPPSTLPFDSVVIPTFHPAAILRQMTWHPWLLADVAKAAKIAREGLPPTKYRQWFIQDATALKRLAASDVDLMAFDSELEPWLVSVTTEDEVHVFEWSEEFREPLTTLLTSPRVWKIAHNWTHDYAFFRKCLKITVARPIYDTQGGAHVLNTALQKELSPHISTRFTNWPYHKWLVNHDLLIYCGMDGVVSYDSYRPQIGELHNRKLYEIADHDHKLLTPLMEMQAIGFKIDEAERERVEQELNAKLAAEDGLLQIMVAPIIDRKINKFEKPHLFQVERKCDCCGGGKMQREHCYSCYFAEHGDPPAVTKKTAIAYGFKTIKAFKAAWCKCSTCNGSGRVIKRLEFNPDSPDQLADVLYRGLGIRPRRFKGNETTKAAQLDPIKDSHPIVAKVVETSEIRADYDTVHRLRAGPDGLLHCVFDPFGTGSGRVASKEGLLEAGTNAQNLPKAARRFVVPRDGYVFLHPDMEQIEARVAAVQSKDAKLLEAFTTPIDWPGHPKHGKIDSHTRVVQLFDANGVKITRDQAKRFTYAGIFGGRAAQLAVELTAEAFRKGEGVALTTAQVQQGLDTFFRIFSGVKRWMENMLQEVLETRKLRNPLTGREFTWLGYIIDTRKRSPDYGGLNYEIKKQVWSRLPQDTAAYILALGLNDMYYKSGEWGKLLTPVQHGHDALLIETPIERVEEGRELAIKLLTRELWGLKFPCEMKVGRNWYEASGGV